MNWLDRKRAEFGQFDLSALNLVGWLLFLSAVGVILTGAFLAVEPGDAGVGRKVVAVAVLLLGVAWFQLGKAVLGLAGVPVYRAGK
jgi:hypothetical protein